MKKVSKVIVAKCIDLSHEGKGVVKYEDKLGFIDSLLIGEEAEIEITYLKKDIFFGRIKKLLNVSPNRIQPKCKIHSSCGGCALQHLSYQEQLKFKQKKVKENLKRIGGIDFNVKETIGMENPYQYRNKIQVPIKLDQRKQIVSGFYKEKTHDIMPVDHCFIEDERAADILTTIKRLMKKHKILPYDEDKRIGVIRHVLIRTSYHKDEVMVVLVTNCDSFPGRNNLVQDLKKEQPNISTIVQNINTRATNVILGEKERVLFGRGFITDILCGLNFKISAKSFYQINPVQTEKLYNKAIEIANINKNDTILDAYCGIGTIGMIASSKCKKVVGVEIVKEAVEDAKKNANYNHIDNIEFFEDDASEFIVNKQKNTYDFDVVFMDPPRKGSDEKFLLSLLKAKPKKIVYVSCDPSTLARDLKTLSKDYIIFEVIPVDMFPFTYHVETIAILYRKDYKNDKK